MPAVAQGRRARVQARRQVKANDGRQLGEADQADVRDESLTDTSGVLASQPDGSPNGGVAQTSVGSGPIDLPAYVEHNATTASAAAINGSGGHGGNLPCPPLLPVIGMPAGVPCYIALPWLSPTTCPSGSANIASHVSGAGLNFGITTVPPSAWTFASVASRSGTDT